MGCEALMETALLSQQPLELRRGRLLLRRRRRLALLAFPLERRRRVGHSLGELSHSGVCVSSLRDRLTRLHLQVRELRELGARRRERLPLVAQGHVGQLGVELRLGELRRECAHLGLRLPPHRGLVVEFLLSGLAVRLAMLPAQLLPLCLPEQKRVRELGLGEPLLDLSKHLDAVELVGVLAVGGEPRAPTANQLRKPEAPTRLLGQTRDPVCSLLPRLLLDGHLLGRHLHHTDAPHTHTHTWSRGTP